MHAAFKFLIFCFLFYYPNSLISKTKELKLIDVFQKKVDDIKKFDLSGITNIENDIFVISDKNKTPYIYKLNWKEKKWIPIPEYKININTRKDFEALDSCSKNFYIANESDQKVYKLTKDKKLSEIKIQFKEKNIQVHKWKRNTGLEGLAIDCNNKMAYLAKEREPRRIYVVDLESGSILDQFNLNDSDSGDYSDLKFQNGFLYVLERQSRIISKLNPTTQEVVDQVSFKSSATINEKALFGPTPFGLAEGLLILDKEIWVAFDNNGKKATKEAEKKYAISGKQPIIIKFKKPRNF